ncbi:MAG: hypothetical protein IJ796_10610 [Lachnospiraceae bacterium]|nr:hypothetical protein [Lachnospiraceae bacterium]
MSDYRNQSRREYEYGSAARDYDYRQSRLLREEYEPHRARRPRKANSFSLLGFTIAGIAFVIFAINVVNYVQLQSELTRKVKTVASKQIELNNLISSNDEHYSRITSSVDLESIESIARGELGMTYAGEGQVVTYTSAGNDYMRKADSN